MKLLIIHNFPILPSYRNERKKTFYALKFPVFFLASVQRKFSNNMFKVGSSVSKLNFYNTRNYQEGAESVLNVNM